MRIVREIQEIRDIIKKQKMDGKSIGLVPTMGYFHEGHYSLMRAARDECSFVVVSLFVNPTQFGPGEDIDRYPRDLEGDVRGAEAAGADVIFAPCVAEMYGEKHRSYVTVEKLTDGLCGAHRPGHFKGVTTVVAKLFNIIAPDYAYFGQKDAQQSVVIKKMINDLNYNIQLRILPTIREADGLAMSSRNAYFNIEQKKKALCLSKALFSARDLILKGEKNAGEIIKHMERIINAETGVRIQYVAIVDKETLEPVSELQGKALMALAVFVDNVRLIDNMPIILNQE